MRDYEGARMLPTREHQAKTGEKLREFLRHLENQDVAAVESMLAADVRMFSDGGGEFAAALNPILGRGKVARLFLTLAAKRQPGYAFEFRMLNGSPAVLIQGPAPVGQAPRFVIQIDVGPDGDRRDPYGSGDEKAERHPIRFVADRTRVVPMSVPAERIGRPQRRQIG